MRTIRDIDISSKRVFIRADFNVPLDSKRKITDDARIEALLPTLKYALSQEACVILASHLGRPNGQVKMEFSLQPVSRRLGEILGMEVMMAPDCIGADVAALVGAMQGGKYCYWRISVSTNRNNKTTVLSGKTWLVSVTSISTMPLPCPIVPMLRWFQSRNMHQFQQQDCS